MVDKKIKSSAPLEPLSSAQQAGSSRQADLEKAAKLSEINDLKTTTSDSKNVLIM